MESFSVDDNTALVDTTVTRNWAIVWGLPSTRHCVARGGTGSGWLCWWKGGAGVLEDGQQRVAE
jgi:hypothetical protein